MSSFVPLVGLLTSALFWMPGFEDLDEALTAVRKRRSLKGKVSERIAREAVDEIPEAAGRRLRALARVARAGKADAALARALLNRFVEAPDGDAAVIELLGELPDAAVDPVALKIPKARRLLGERVVLLKAKVPQPLARLYVRQENPRDLARLLKDWVNADPAPRGLRALLRALDRTKQPKDLFLEMLPVQVPPAQEDRWVRALSHIIYSHDEVLGEVVEMLDRLDTRQRPRLLGAIGNAPHDHDEAHGPGHAKAHAQLREKVIGHVTAAVKGTNKAEKARAIASAERLELHALMDDVLRATTDSEDGVQAAAIAALPGLLKATFLHIQTSVKTKNPDRRKLQAAMEKARARVVAAVEQAIGSARGKAQVAALLTGRRLRLRGPLRTVVGKIATDTHAPKANRLAALRCFSGVMPRDAATVDLLLGLMEDKDREIATGAWRALQGVARVRLPFRMKLWRSWRERVKLKK